MPLVPLLQVACDRGPKKVKHIRALFEELSLGDTATAYAVSVRGRSPTARMRIRTYSHPFSRMTYAAR